ncbi:MAG: biopolymer transporter ExbD [Planctomycetota bacterium]|jgi:biopolymer transport protein ExbD|nr:biopolymer transporter ExbD [Planctomycetota bacterium]|tara:strand:- start:876 stop:1328 length:453 start_codon:yes stop_codon:yes gene_type:complete
MRFDQKSVLPENESDMTSMIDMAFQLIAFFMVLINFSDTVADQTIKLPISELARPADESAEHSLVLNMTGEGRIRHMGTLLNVDDIATILDTRQRMIRLRRELVKEEVPPTTIIIRSDGNCPSGKLQELIQQCQQYGFEKFVLRAKEREE